MKIFLKNKIGEIVFYGVIILTIICVNLRYEYLNNTDYNSYKTNIVAKN